MSGSIVDMKWLPLISAMITVIVGRCIWTCQPLMNFIWTVSASTAILFGERWVGTLLATCIYWGSLTTFFLLLWKLLRFVNSWPDEK